MSLFGKEFYFNLDRYNNFKEGKLALAQTIQNLCLIEPGTYPNNPELGLGIENYIFEFSDNTTINKLRSSLDEQINRFISTEHKVTSNIITTKLGQKDVLVVSIIISDISNIDIVNDTEKEKQEPINIVFGINNNQLVSEIII